MDITKSGFVAIVGRPNVGKSTLSNCILGEKLSIVSKKPQTTRTKITAIYNEEDVQIVFLDTPGFLKPKNRLGEYMSGIVSRSIGDVDIALLVVEPSEKGPGEIEMTIIERIKEEKIPAILVINKSDTLEKEKLLPVIDAYKNAMEFEAIVPISAKTGDGVSALLSEIKKHIPNGPRLYEDDYFTDQTEREITAEVIREKILTCLDEEVPHGVAVEVTAFKEQEGGGLIKISANLYCEKDSHKGIIIGKNGAMLKKIGSDARADLERFFDTKIYLELWVKVSSDWRNHDKKLKEFGFR